MLLNPVYGDENKIKTRDKVGSHLDTDCFWHDTCGLVIYYDTTGDGKGNLKCYYVKTKHGLYELGCE